MLRDYLIKLRNDFSFVFLAINADQYLIEPTVVLDLGFQDKIPKILIGSGLAKHWLYKLLFMDALQYLSNGLITFSLTR